MTGAVYPWEIVLHCLYLLLFGILSEKFSGSQNDNKSGTLAEVVPGFFASDNLNTWVDGWLEREILRCSPAHAHSSSGCLQDATSQSCFRPALCPKVYFSSVVCYCLKCQPPPALPRQSCEVFPPSLHLAREVGRFWDYSRAFLKLLFPLSGGIWHWVSHCFLVLTLPLQADRWPASRERPFLEGEIRHIN